MAPTPPGAFPATIPDLPPDADFIADAVPHPLRERDRLRRGRPEELEALGAEFRSSGADLAAAFETSTNAQNVLAGGFDSGGAPVYSAAVHRRALPQNFPELGELSARAGSRFTELAGHLRSAVAAAGVAEDDMYAALQATRTRWVGIIEAATGPDGLIPHAAVPGVLADRSHLMSVMQGGTDAGGRAIVGIRQGYEGEVRNVRNAVADLGFVPAPAPPAPVDPAGAARAEGAADAARLSESLAAPVDAGTLGVLDAATARLRVLEDKLVSGQQLDEVDRAYVTSLIDTLGADRLGALGEHVEGAVGAAGLTGDPARVRYEEALAPFGTAITGTGSGTVLDPATGAPREARYEDVPAAARALIETRPGVRDRNSGLLYPNDEFASGVGVGPDPYDPGRDLRGAGVAGMDGYTTITDMLGQSRVAPSADLARHVIEGAVAVRQDLNTAEANARNELTTRGIGTEDQFTALAGTVDASAAETALSYGARSVAGSSAALTDPATLPALMGLNWETGEGAAAVIAAGTERDLAAGGGTQAQSDAALAVFQEAGRDPIGYLGRPAVDPSGAGFLPGRMTDPVHDAVLDVGVQYLDSFARGPSATESRSIDNAVDVLGTPLGWTPQLDIGDQREFLRFVVGSDPGQVEQFWAQAKALNHTELVNALANGSNAQINEAFRSAGQLDGALRASVADQTALLEQTGDQVAIARNVALEARAEQGLYNTLATAGKETLGSIPGVAAAKAVTSPVLSVLTEMAKGEIGIQTLPVPIPAGDAASRTEDADRAAAARVPSHQDLLVAGALEELGAFPDGQLPPILTVDELGPDGLPGPDGIVDASGSNIGYQRDTRIAVDDALKDWSERRGLDTIDGSEYSPQELRNNEGDGVADRPEESEWNRDGDGVFYGPDPARRTPFFDPGPPP